MVFLFQVMPQSSPTLCTKGGEFGLLLEVVCLHTHPLINGEFAFTQSPIGDGESTRTPTHPFAQPHFVRVFFFAFGLQPHSVRVFFFVVLVTPMSILSPDHFACKMGLLTNLIHKELEEISYYIWRAFYVQGKALGWGNSQNMGLKMRQHFGMFPTPWALPIVKHEAEFIMNHYVNYEAYEQEGFYAYSSIVGRFLHLQVGIISLHP